MSDGHRVSVRLTDEEFSQLQKLATAERRPIPYQAAKYIADALWAAREHAAITWPLPPEPRHDPGPASAHDIGQQYRAALPDDDGLPPPDVRGAVRSPAEEERLAELERVTQETLLEMNTRSSPMVGRGIR